MTRQRCETTYEAAYELGRKRGRLEGLRRAKEIVRHIDGLVGPPAAAAIEAEIEASFRPLRQKNKQGTLTNA